MEADPDLSDVEVHTRPKNHVAQGTIVTVAKMTRAEVFDLDEDEEPKYGDRSDEYIHIEAEIEVEGREYTIVEDMRFYEQPSDRSEFGAFIQKYGAPERGLEVTIQFDKEGEAEIVV